MFPFSSFSIHSTFQFFCPNSLLPKSKVLEETFCFEACECVSVSGDKIHTISLRWPLDLLLNSLPVSYTNLMLVMIKKCWGKVTTVSFFFVFIFFMNSFFLSKFRNQKSLIEFFRFISCVCVALCGYKVHSDSISVSLKLHSHSLPLSQLPFVQVAVLYYLTAVQKRFSDLFICSRMLYHWAISPQR